METFTIDLLSSSIMGLITNEQKSEVSQLQKPLDFATKRILINLITPILLNPKCNIPESKEKLQIIKSLNILNHGKEKILSYIYRSLLC